jgi:hypothetical protein
VELVARRIGKRLVRCAGTVARRWKMPAMARGGGALAVRGRERAPGRRSEQRAEQMKAEVVRSAKATAATCGASPACGRHAACAVYCGRSRWRGERARASARAEADAGAGAEQARPASAVGPERRQSFLKQPVKMLGTPRSTPRCAPKRLTAGPLAPPASHLVQGRRSAVADLAAGEVASDVVTTGRFLSATRTQ